LPKRDFQKPLPEEANEVLLAIRPFLGKRLISIWKKVFRIGKKDIPCEVEALAYAIKGIFRFGAGCLESLIMKRPCRIDGTLDVVETVEHFRFNEYIAAKQNIPEKERVARKTDDYLQEMI